MSKARFIEPLLLLCAEKLPKGPEFQYELKFDGYRALGIKSGGKAHLRSRNDNDFSERYPSIVKALAEMLDDTVIDGEVVALDPDGKPSFNLLQNYGSASSANLRIHLKVCSPYGGFTKHLAVPQSRESPHPYRGSDASQWQFATASSADSMGPSRTSQGLESG